MIRPYPARDRLIVALDVPSVGEAEALVARLGDSVTFYKVGLQLVFAGGLPFAERLARPASASSSTSSSSTSTTPSTARSQHRRHGHDLRHHPRLPEGDARGGRRARRAPGSSSSASPC